MAWHDEGHEPDYRFSLANERTFLAWTRTALALLAGGVLLHEFASRMEPTWLLGALSVALAIASVILSAGAFLQWRANQVAMRNDRGLPRPHLIGVLAAFTCVLSVVTVGALLLR
jgi:putative membrane protein